VTGFLTFVFSDSKRKSGRFFYYSKSSAPIIILSQSKNSPDISHICRGEILNGSTELTRISPIVLDLSPCSLTPEQIFFKRSYFERWLVDLAILFFAFSTQVLAQVCELFLSHLTVLACTHTTSI
jgi:hypothetical protein